MLKQRSLALKSSRAEALVGFSPNFERSVLGLPRLFAVVSFPIESDFRNERIVGKHSPRYSHLVSTGHVGKHSHSHSEDSDVQNTLGVF